MTISAKQVQSLREITGAGIMDCKKALAETGGDVEKAVNYLRQQGSVKAAKRAHRATSEGLIGYCFRGDVCGLVELDCETDFVARTDKFTEFVAALAEQVARDLPDGLEELKDSPFIKDKSQKVSDLLTGLIASTGENITLKRFKTMKAANGEKVGGYIHPGSKIGVIVKISGGNADDNIVKDVAMHVAAMSPVYLASSDIPELVLEKERTIFLGMDDLKGKPSQTAEKIVGGRLQKWKKEISLLEQVFIKDSSGKMTVSDFLKKVDPKLKICEFTRYQVGEES